jgi:hypothetical protein
MQPSRKSYWMTRDGIEIGAERLMDALDHRYMTTSMTREQYYAGVAEIRKWAEESHAKNRKDCFR